MEKIIERKDQKIEDTWDLESLFSNLEEWELEFERVKKASEEFLKYKGIASKNAQSLYSALSSRDDLYRRMENIYTYAHLKLDEDTRENSSQVLMDKGMSLYIDVGEKTSFLYPEILKLEDSQIIDFLEGNEELKLYKKELEDLIKQKKHVLNEREEYILAQVQEIGKGPEKIYSMLSNADIKFSKIKNNKGDIIEITSGNFIPLLESEDREFRKKVFEKVYGVYEGYKNTFAATLSGEIKNNIFNSRIRNYENTRVASLSENHIPIKVYDNLIEVVHDNLDIMHKYMEIRKRALKLEQLHMYDIYTPIVDAKIKKYTYDQGISLIKEALKPLGEDYIKILEEGINDRWIDIYENRGKRSGAYSSGSYDSKPYILLNYHETLDNVFTIAHELGHSIHSYLTRKNQPYVYGNYGIFLAEVASTVNEALLLEYMLENTKDKGEKLYLLNHYLESFRTTVFRQTMFAEFEKNINEYLEKGEALTAEYLGREYEALNRLYYGENVNIDREISVEWARIPHFYYNFYVFQYATGFSSAIDISKRILKDGEVVVEKYLEFLKSGSSDYPIEVLNKAGVDMLEKRPLENAMNKFRQLVNEMDSLI